MPSASRRRTAALRHTWSQSNGDPTLIATESHTPRLSHPRSAERGGGRGYGQPACNSSSEKRMRNCRRAEDLAGATLPRSGSVLAPTWRRQYLRHALTNPPGTDSCHLTARCRCTSSCRRKRRVPCWIPVAEGLARTTLRRNGSAWYQQ